MKAKFSEAAYEARIEGLFRRFQSVQTAGFGAGAYKPGLAGMLRFCDALGFFGQAAAEVAERVAAGINGASGAEVVASGSEGAGGLAAGGAAKQPAGIALPYPCIHVAGTNGKGSVCSMLASALAACAGISAVPSLNNTQIRDGACNFSTPSLNNTQNRDGACNFSTPSLNNTQNRDGAPSSAEPFLESGQNRNHSTENAEPFLESDQNRNASGRKVGLYTSPHLLDFRERMRVVTDDGWYLPTKEWVWNFLEEYEEVFNGSPDASATAPHLPSLSFFEITTGMAFKWFAEQGVDCAVIEVGLGGRLDSTNVIRPSLCVITSIGLDHCAILGGTRAEIAAEKVGIFKPGVPAVVWGRDTETSPVFERVAASVGCPLYYADEVDVGESFGGFAGAGATCENYGSAAGGGRQDFSRLLQALDLRGPYQESNLRTVLATLSVLTMHAALSGAMCAKWPVLHTEGGKTGGPCANTPVLHTDGGETVGMCAKGQVLHTDRPGEWEKMAEALKHTAARTGFRGRWERFLIPAGLTDSGRACGEQVTTGAIEVICDIGHNSAALAINFARLEQYLTLPERADNTGNSHGEGASSRQSGATGVAGQGTRSLTIVYGIMADKDLGSIAPLMPAEARYFLVAPDSPRSLPAKELLARLKALRPELDLTVAGSGSVAEGIAAALEAGSCGLATATHMARSKNIGRLLPAPSESAPLVYIGGSTFVVAEAIPLLERHGTVLEKLNKKNLTNDD